jgi:hypothetical protein
VGLRYYETRPFLVVRKPYPIASEPFLVHGVLSTDGKTFVVSDAPEELGLPARTELQVGRPLAAAAAGGAIAQGERTTEPPQPAGEEEPATEDIKSACEKGTQSSTKDAEGATSQTNQVDCTDTSGQRLAFSSISLETDLTGTAVVPINELFSIVYLPDYDREFFIESKARWGMSRLHITRGPGGALLAYNSVVDNSAVVKPLFDAWNALVSAATKAAVIKIEPKAQGERVDETRTAPLTPQGTVATLRIHRVKFAVPGAYPFIKPQESDRWKAADETQRQRMLVPSFPYQIPYDYFTVLIAEQLLDPAGSSALVANVSATQTPGEAPAGAQGSAGGAAGAQFNCLRDAQLPTSKFNKANANTILQSDASLQNSVTAVTITQKDTHGCAQKLTVQFAGDAAKADAIKAKLQHSFPKAEFDVTQ